MDEQLKRAQILMQHRRYDEAEKILQSSLSQQPDNAYVLALYAELSIQQEKLDKAKLLIENAIGLAPEMGFLFYIKAKVHLEMEAYDEAETNLQLAIEKEPYDDDNYALLAAIKLARKQYQAALEIAEKALEINPQNIQGLNTRATALLKLDRKEDSFQTIDGVLREDPNNAFTHMNYGWNLLEKGDHRKALIHFQEALKYNPNLEYAKAGMVEALKANNIFYRAFLKYAFWIGNLTKKYQWGVVIGFYALFRVIKIIASQNQALLPILLPVMILLSLIAFSTWILSPVGNLFLRLNKYGKHILTKDEQISSTFVGISMLVSLAGLIGYFVMKDDIWLMVVVFGLTMMVPLGTMLTKTKVKDILVYFTAIVAFVGIGAIIIAFKTDNIFNKLTAIYLFTFFIYQWVVNYFQIEASNK